MPARQQNDGPADPTAPDTNHAEARLAAVCTAVYQRRQDLGVQAGAMLHTAGTVRDPALLAAAWSVFCAVTASEGERPADCVGSVQRAADGVDRLSATELGRFPGPVGLLGCVELWLGRWEAAGRHLALAQSLMDERCPAGMAPMVAEAQGVLAVIRGDLAAAAVHLETAVATAVGPSSMTSALARQCWVFTMRGLLSQAGEVARRALAAAPQADPRIASIAYGMAAQLALHSGDVATCERLLTESDHPVLEAADPCDRTALLQLLAAAQMLRGNGPAALTWARQCDAAATATGLPLPAAIASLARSQAQSVEDPAGSLAPGMTAVAQFEQAGVPLYLGYAHLQVGQACDRLGDRPRALHHFAAGHRIFVGCGAHTGVEQTERERKRVLTTLTSGGGEPDQLGELTAREREVAQLVGSGLTNREIAQALFVSPRTVETHVHRIFEKLGLANRAALAALVVRGTGPS